MNNENKNIAHKRHGRRQRDISIANSPFKKGLVANPNGRPKLGDSAAEIIRSEVKHAEWAAITRKLVSQALDGDVRAYIALTDRAFGKPIQKTEIEDVTQDPTKLFRFHIVKAV